jgi:hypothetical protein
LVFCVNWGAKNPDDAVTYTECGRSIMRVEREGVGRREEVPFRMHSHWGGVLVGMFLMVIGLMFLFKQILPIL